MKVVWCAYKSNKFDEADDDIDIVYATAAASDLHKLVSLVSHTILFLFFSFFWVSNGRKNYVKLDYEA